MLCVIVFELLVSSLVILVNQLHGRVSLVLGLPLVFIPSDVLSFLQLLFSAQSHV